MQLVSWLKTIAGTNLHNNPVSKNLTGEKVLKIFEKTLFPFKNKGYLRNFFAITGIEKESGSEPAVRCRFIFHYDSQARVMPLRRASSLRGRRW